MCLTVIITTDKRVFHLFILSLLFSENVYVYDRIYYRQTSTFRPRHMVYVTVVGFVCAYVRIELAHPCTTVCFGVGANLWISVSTEFSHSYMIL